jgi:hypothetical protein
MFFLLLGKPSLLPWFLPEPGFEIAKLIGLFFLIAVQGTKNNT